MIRTKSGSRKLSILLALWVYTYALFYFVPLVIPSTTMLMYLWLVVMDIWVIWINRSVPIRLLGFLMAYILIALFNVAIVPYKYYVAIDAFCGMAVFLPALLIISSSQFDLEGFLGIWNKFAIAATALSPAAILLMQKKAIDYGVFTYLNLPNCIIFSYMIMEGKEGGLKKKISFLLAAANFFIILSFGGRMAAFTAAFSIFLGFMISSSVKLLEKVFLVLSIGAAGVLAIRNLNAILERVQVVLDKYSLSSRSFSLLVEQMRTSGKGFYMTRRNVIYDEMMEYIMDRLGLPGGFGVSLNVSNGQFYHPHNLFLQLAVMFGVAGGLFFMFLVIYRLMKIKSNSLPFEYKFTLLVLADYLVISFTGGSILNNFIAIIGIGMVFFYRGRRQKRALNP